MKNIAILAGSGKLPIIAYRASIEKNITPYVICFDPLSSHQYKESIHIEPYKISKILKYLDQKNIHHVLLAGKVSRSNINKLIFDTKGRELLSILLKQGFNDESIFSTISKYLCKYNIKIIDPIDLIEELLAPKGNINEVSFDRKIKKDIETGLKILKVTSSYDIGQSLIVERKVILGIEAAEGTDELIKRCSKLKSNSGVLIKICKPNQDMKIDLPCIGINTVKNIVKYGYAGIAIESNKSLILDKEACLDLANNNGVFIYGI